jgi:hypothetical protein
VNTIRQKALRLLRSPYFFQKLVRDLQKTGLVGEERNALIVYVVATSRLLADPMALFVKGPSSVGKSYLTDKSLDFIPCSEVRKITGSSNKSWNYQQRNLRHKVVYLKERNAVSGPVHPLRLLISERELAYYVTVRRGNRSEVEKVVTKGPIAAVSTTRDRVEIDDETRHLSIWLDESPEQTGRIVAATVEREVENKKNLDRNAFASWREVQRLLKSRSKFPIRFRVWLKQVARSVDTTSIWARRLFPTFLRAVKTITLIRSFRWTTSELKQMQRIPVRFSDVAITIFIFGPAFAQSLQRAEDMNVEVRQRIAAISAGRGDKPVSAYDLSQNMSISMDKAYSLIRKAESMGTISRTNATTKTNRKLYLSTPDKGFLPEPHEMFDRFVRKLKRVKFVHPLTGKWVVYERD